jgi:hypothetical protein
MKKSCEEKSRRILISISGSKDGHAQYVIPSP